MSLLEEYTDNFFLTEKDRKENFRTSLIPSLTLSLNRGVTRGDLTLGVAASHDTATDSFEIAQVGSLGGSFTWRATPLWMLTVSNFFTRSDDPVSADSLRLRRERDDFMSNTFQFTSDLLLGRVQTRQYYRFSAFFNGDETFTHTAGLDGALRVGPRTTLRAGYEYLDADSSSRDVTGHSFTSAVSQAVTALLSLGLSGGYSLRDVENDEDSTSLSRRNEDYALWNSSLFATYRVPGRWVVTAGIGYSQLLPESGRSPDGSLSTFSSFSYYFARAVATVAVDQGFSETFAGGENFGVVETQGITGTLSYPVTPLVTLTATGFYRKNKFTGIATDETSGTTKTWGAMLGASYQVLRWLALRLDYTRTDASVENGTDYIENRGTLSLNAAF